MPAPRNAVTPRQVEEAYFAEGGCVADAAIVQKATNLALCMDSAENGGRGSVILLGDTYTGKTTTLRAAARILGKQEGIISIFPSAFSPVQRFGSTDDKGRWQDGIITKVLRKMGSGQQQGGENGGWLVFHGPLDADWADPVEKVIDERFIDLDSGEHLKIPQDLGVVFETDDISRVSSSKKKFTVLQYSTQVIEAGHILPVFSVTVVSMLRLSIRALRSVLDENLRSLVTQATIVT